MANDPSTQTNLFSSPSLVHIFLDSGICQRPRGARCCATAPGGHTSPVHDRRTRRRGLPAKDWKATFPRPRQARETRRRGGFSACSERHPVTGTSEVTRQLQRTQRKVFASASTGEVTSTACTSAYVCAATFLTSGDHLWIYSGGKRPHASHTYS